MIYCLIICTVIAILAVQADVKFRFHLFPPPPPQLLHHATILFPLYHTASLWRVFNCGIYAIVIYLFTRL
jgi:hypothetical protein